MKINWIFLLALVFLTGFVSATAVNDSFTLTEGQASFDTFGSDSILSNDDVIVEDIGLIKNVSNGTLELQNVTGEIRYIPFLGFSGVDYFIYNLSDNSTAWVILGVNNTAPVAVADKYVLLNNVSGNILTNDSNVENDTIYITNSSVNNGTLELASDGSFNYTAGKLNGVAYFTYSLSDLHLSSNNVEVVFVIGTNTAPVASADRYSLLNSSYNLTVNDTNVLANDTNAENDDLVIYLISDVTNGSLTLYQNGSFDYVPNAGFVGVDNFTYQLSDRDQNSSSVQVSIYVNKSYPSDNSNNNNNGGGSSGGGSSGGSGSSQVCVPEYYCGEWADCIDGVQSRVCAKTNATCFVNMDEPLLTRNCIALNGNNATSSNNQTNQTFFSGITGAVTGVLSKPISWIVIIFLILLGLAYWIVAKNKKNADKSAKVKKK